MEGSLDAKLAKIQDSVSKFQSTQREMKTKIEVNQSELTNKMDALATMMEKIVGKGSAAEKQKKNILMKTFETYSSSPPKAVKVKSQIV